MILSDKYKNQLKPIKSKPQNNNKIKSMSNKKMLLSNKHKISKQMKTNLNPSFLRLNSSLKKNYKNDKKNKFG